MSFYSTDPKDNAKIYFIGLMVLKRNYHSNPMLIWTKHQ